MTSSIRSCWQNPNTLEIKKSIKYRFILYLWHLPGSSLGRPFSFARKLLSDIYFCSDLAVLIFATRRLIGIQRLNWKSAKLASRKPLMQPIRFSFTIKLLFSPQLEGRFICTLSENFQEKSNLKFKKNETRSVAAHLSRKDKTNLKL